MYIEMSKIDLAILSLISFYLSCLKIEMKFDHEMVFFLQARRFQNISLSVDSRMVFGENIYKLWLHG